MNDEAGAGQYHFDPATYLAMVLAEIPAYRDLQHHVAETARGVDAGSILELGVGTGETAAAVLAVHPGAQLVGIDESEPMLALARDRFPGADLRVQRLEVPLPEGTYDLVVSALAVHHFDGNGKADLFHRVHGRLRPGGRFVLADVVVPDDPRDAVTPVGPPHDKPSPHADQLSWLQQAGLRPTVRWQQQISSSSPPTARPHDKVQRPITRLRLPNERRNDLGSTAERSPRRWHPARPSGTG